MNESINKHMNYIYLRLTTNVLQGFLGQLLQFYNFTLNIFSGEE